jgi:hypothetical protein
MPADLFQHTNSDAGSKRRLHNLGRFSMFRLGFLAQSPVAAIPAADPDLTIVRLARTSYFPRLEGIVDVNRAARNDVLIVGLASQ